MPSSRRPVAANAIPPARQGVTARVAYLMGAEKARCGRGPEVTSARTRPGPQRLPGPARRDLGVARFTDRLVGTPGPPPQIFTAPRPEPDGRESDMDYRRRPPCAAGRCPRGRAGRGGERAGAPDDPPAGWLAELGGTQRIEIVEQTNPLAVGVLLAPAAPRRGTTSSPRCARPAGSRGRVGAADADEAARMLTAAAARRPRRATCGAGGRVHLRGRRRRPGAELGRPQPRAGRAGPRRARRHHHLGVDPGSGSRWRQPVRVGLGCDLVLPAADQAEQLRVAAAAWPGRPANPDRVAGALAAASAAATAGPDPA